MRMGIIASVLLTLLTPTAGFAADQETVYAVGDSITQGNGADQDWKAWPARIGAVREGKSGGCLVAPSCTRRQPFIEQYASKVLVKHPDVVILAYGVNDLASGQVGVRGIVAGMARIVRRNEKRGIETYVATITPVGLDLYGLLGNRRVELNRLIRSEFHGHVIHFSHALQDPVTGLLPKRYDSGDGLHPNGRAYKKLARVAALTLRRDGHQVRLPRR